MKSLKHISLLIFVALFALNCKNESNPEVKTVNTDASKQNSINPNATYAKAEFSIDGMTCAMGCAATIEKKIAKMEGVKTARVDFDTRLAMVEYDVAKVTPDKLIETVSQVGDTYKVSGMKTSESSKSNCKKECSKQDCENKTAEEKAACKKSCCGAKA